MIPPDIERVALLGWHVFPASRTSRKGAFKGAHLSATTDLNQIARWCEEYPRINWRVLFGPSKLWGLDVDVPSADHKDDGVAALKSLVERNAALPARPMTRSGGGGYCLFFRHTGERIIGKTGHPAPGIDPRRGMLSVTIPPSVHVTTRRPYLWITPPWVTDAPAAPQWLLSLVEPPPEPAYSRAPIDTSDAARGRLYRAALAVMDAQPGERNAVLNRRAYQAGRLIGNGLLDQQEAANALYGAARQNGLDHAEIQATLRSGINAGRRAAHGR
jgi:hypothetical protein